MKNGFTLLEVLIAAILFTIGVIAIVAALGRGLIGSADSEDMLIGINLAQKRLEEFRNLDYDTEVISEAKAAVSGFTGFEREVTVTEPETDLKRVTVTVYWTLAGDEISTSLITYISNN